MFVFLFVILILDVLLFIAGTMLVEYSKRVLELNKAIDDLLLSVQVKHGITNGKFECKHMQKLYDLRHEKL